jgi:outer membrane protein assembly factor BamD (BamD/ComL family)
MRFERRGDRSYHAAMSGIPLRVVFQRTSAIAAVAVVLALPQMARTQTTYVLDESAAWLETQATMPGTPEHELAEARAALAAGNARAAERLASRWIRDHSRHPSMPHAYLIRGDAKLLMNDDYKALFDYEYVARMHPGSEVFVTALERELEIAKEYARGKKRKLWGMRIVDASEEAQELFIRIQERMPGSRIAEEAGIELADFYFRKRDMSLAAEAYDLFIQNYPRSDQISKARRRLIYAHLASFKGPAFDAAGLNEARLRLHDLKAVDPLAAEQIGADALLVRIDESAAEKLLQNARWYIARNDPISAELTIRRLVGRHPHTVAAAEALRLVDGILPRLPARAREQAPDYDVLRAGLEPQIDTTDERR